MPPVKGPLDKSSPESSSDPPSKQRKRPGRVPVSCAECRRLKLRCDRKVPCETCVKRGCAALCPDGSLITGGKGTRQAVADVEDLKKQIDQLQSRSNALETALKTLQAAVSDEPHPLLTDNPDLHMLACCSDSPSADTMSQESSSLSVDEEDALDAFGTLTLGPRGETRFFGQTSRSEYLIHAPERLSTSEVRFPRLTKELVDEAYKELDVPCTSREIGVEAMKLLPPLSQACQLCESFLEFGKYVWYPIPRQYLFDDIVGKVYQHWKDKSHCNIAATHQLALMWIVYALATLMDPKSPPFSVEAHEYYLLSRLCLRYAPPAHDTTLTATQTMIYMAQYLEMSDCEPAHTQSHKAWMQIGHAVKLGHSIGLHMSSCRWRLGEETTLQRNRVFWQLFFQDTWLSFGFGRPPSINLAFVDCELPSDGAGPADQDKRELGFHVWSWQYTKLFHTIMITAFGAKAANYAKVMEMDKHVRDFPVPPWLRVQCGATEVPPPTPALTMQRCLATLYKEMTLLNLHRQYFSQALNDMPQDPLRHRFGPSVMAIYRSAWRIFATVRCGHRSIPGIISRIGLVWSYALAGSIVMCLIIVRAPTSNLAKASLAELGKLCDLFEEAAPQSQIVANNLEVVRKLRKQANDAVNKVHAAEDTARIHTELDRLGGKTYLICPTDERRMDCPDRPHTPKTGYGASYDPPVQPEMIHPALMQDMRAFEVNGLGQDNDQAGMFNLDFPSTGAAFDQADMDFGSFPDFDVVAAAMASSVPTAGNSGTPVRSAGAGPDVWMNGNRHGAPTGDGLSGMHGVNGVNGANGVNRVNGVHSTGSNGNMGAGVSSGPPVLDATWQAFVEQLGF
ncbi:hypothetical protein C8Q80DRAFT_1128643 [Daedaleopsis nitida]|nr:hypothetical protein C8Q80DRAFT_1128643 [Daedaleopsis nitida]